MHICINGWWKWGIENEIRFTREILVKDFIKNKLDILAIQETHLTDIEHITCYKKDKKYELFISECTSKYHGVGFIVKSELNPVFHKLSGRVIKCDITLQEEKKNR